MTVSGHSGLPEAVELRMMQEKAKVLEEKKARRMSIVCGVLDTMPPPERRRFLAEIVAKYIK